VSRERRATRSAG